MKYEIIIILCADKKINGKFPEFKDGKYLGGQTRMDAAVIFCKEHKNAKIVLIGGYNPDNGTADCYKKSQKTEDMKDYLIEKGIDEKRISIINSLPCTRHNLVAVFNTFRDEFTNTKPRIAILTNKYHLPRTLALWQKLTSEEENFKDIRKPEPIAAEDIIGNNDDYKDQDEYITRIKQEQIGLNQIKKGKNGNGNDFYREDCIKGDFDRIIKEQKDILLTTKEKLEYDQGE